MVMAEALNGRPPRICFVVATNTGYPPGIGGLAVAARRVSGYLREAGFEVHVVTYDAVAETGYTTRQDDITVHWVPRKVSEFDTVFGLQHFLRALDAKLDFDLFHGFFLSSVPACMSIAANSGRRRSRPVIASVRGGDKAYCWCDPYFRPLILSSLNKPNCWITCVNRAYLQEITQDIDISGRSCVIHNGAPEIGLRWRVGEENRGVVGTSGEYRRVKDIPLLVRAYCGMPRELRTRLLLVGGFVDEQEEIWSRMLMKEAGAENEFELTGLIPHSEAVPHIAAMNVYVQSSSSEGMPNAVLEAAAMGMPIVATAVGGVPEIFTNERDALLVPHGDPKSMTRAITRILEQPEMATTLSNNALQLCRRHSQQAEKRAWVELHRMLLERDNQETPASQVS
jgi:glycosyltransferase involved in cell wall biosynthesis